MFYKLFFHKFFLKNLLILIVSLVFFIKLSLADNKVANPISIVSDVVAYSIINEAASQFGNTTQFRIPSITMADDGYDFYLFCSDQSNFDMLVTSRKIRLSESEMCSVNKFGELSSFLIGYVALAIVGSTELQPTSLSADDLTKAVSKYSSSFKDVVFNQRRRWLEINSNMKNYEILIYLLNKKPLKSLFMNTIVDSCSQYPSFREIYKMPAYIKEACSSLRGPEFYQELGDMSAIFSMMNKNPKIISLIDFNSYYFNQTSFTIFPFEHTTPSVETITSEVYQLSSPIVVYYKNNSKNSVTGMKLFLDFLLDPTISGPSGIFAQKNLTQLSQDGSINNTNFKLNSNQEYSNDGDSDYPGD